MAKANTAPLSGMRDFLPVDVLRRNYVIDVIERVYQSHGFEPLETPAMERLDTLLGKYGEEGDQLIFRILKRGDKLQRALEDDPTESNVADAGLRYDLTVPLARVVAQYRNDLPRYFKRYQIQPVYRADRPAKGRYREFFQCDLDIVGSSSMTVEADVLAAAAEILTELGFGAADAFAIRLNHRGVLRSLMEAAGVPADLEASAIVAKSLERDGVQLLCCGRQLHLQRVDDKIKLSVDSHGVHYDVTVDHLLVSVGRAPNVHGLGLEEIGVEYDARTGVRVDDRLRTTNPNIYAAGDVCSRYKFTHSADFMARIVIQNALFKGRAKASALTIPWCTYTSPEVAHVGLYEKDATAQGIEIDTYVQHFADVDRAILAGETEGYVKVHTRKGTDNILGATIVAPHAGDLISEITLAMTHKLGLSKIGSTIHPYPTQAEAIRKLGDQYSRTRLTPFIKSLFKKWLAWTR